MSFTFSTISLGIFSLVSIALIVHLGDFVPETGGSHRNLVGFIPPKEGEYTDFSGYVRHIPGTSQRDSLKFLQTFLGLSGSNENDPKAISSAIDSFANETQGWNPLTETFNNEDSKFSSETRIKEISIPLENNSSKLQFVGTSVLSQPLEDLMEIIILTGTNTTNAEWLNFLESWKIFVEKINLIIIQQGDPTRFIPMPSWAQYELYTKNDVERSMGDSSYVIDMESDNSDAYSFGMMVADKEYVYLMDRRSRPHLDPETNTLINPLIEHLLNLLIPANPYYFSPKDSYRAGNDFFRGFPYTLREGVLTSISVGQVCSYGSSDYDSITRIMKPYDKQNDRVVTDIAMSIPHGQMFSLSIFNIAVHRRVVGGIFLIPGILRRKGFDIGEKNMQIFIGWMMKVVLDHVRTGIKYGGKNCVDKIPIEESNESIMQDLKYDIFWGKNAEDIIRFFTSTVLNDRSKDYPDMALRELSEHMQRDLAQIHSAFIDLSTAISEYTSIWIQQHAFHPVRLPISTRSTYRPPVDSPHQCAAFTIVRNDPVMLKIWLRYYNRHFPGALYVLNHIVNVTHYDSPEKINAARINISKADNPKFVMWDLFGDPHGFPVHFLVGSAQVLQQRLFRYGYKCAIFTDVDEIVAPDPTSYPGQLGLSDYVTKFTKDDSLVSIRVVGHTLGHISEQEENNNNVSSLEPVIDWNKPILDQRSYWIPNTKYNKPLLSKVPLRWKPGFHNTFFPPHIFYDKNESLHLLHLDQIDKDFCLKREHDKYHVIKLAHAEESNEGLNMHLYFYPQHLADGSICRYARGRFSTSSGNMIDSVNYGTFDKMKVEWKNNVII